MLLYSNVVGHSKMAFKSLVQEGLPTHLKGEMLVMNERRYLGWLSEVWTYYKYI